MIEQKEKGLKIITKEAISRKERKSKKRSRGVGGSRLRRNERDIWRESRER